MNVERERQGDRGGQGGASPSPAQPDRSARSGERSSADDLGDGSPAVEPQRSNGSAGQSANEKLRDTA